MLLAALAGAAILLLAGPGVSALRGRYVFPRLGYARHTERTDLAALVAVTLALAAVGLAWLEVTGALPGGRIGAALVIPGGLFLLARQSGLGRHYLLAALVLIVAALLAWQQLPPFRLVATLLLATGALMALGGAIALRALVAHHPPVELDEQE